MGDRWAELWDTKAGLLGTKERGNYHQSKVGSMIDALVLEPSAAT